MGVEFGGSVRAAELEVDVFEGVGERTSFVKVLGGLGRTVGEEKPGEEDVGPTKVVAIAVTGCEIPFNCDLVEGTELVGAKEFALRLPDRSEEHTSELQSRFDLVCRLLL